MHNRRMTNRWVTLAVLAAATLALSACGTTSTVSDWIRGKGDSGASESVILGAPDADAYLDELYLLAAGDPGKQADIFEDAESAARLTPGPSTRLRFGLVLATQGHPGADAARAQNVLRQVLDERELLTQAEIALATIHLGSVERLVATDSAAREMQESTTRAARTQSQSLNQRVADVEAENRRLRAELADAKQKLEAITSIERSIREQE